MKALLAALMLVQGIASASERVLFSFDENAIPWHFNARLAGIGRDLPKPNGYIFLHLDFSDEIARVFPFQPSIT